MISQIIFPAANHNPKPSSKNPGELLKRVSILKLKQIPNLPSNDKTSRSEGPGTRRKPIFAPVVGRAFARFGFEPSQEEAEDGGANLQITVLQPDGTEIGAKIHQDELGTTSLLQQLSNALD